MSINAAICLFGNVFCFVYKSRRLGGFTKCPDWVVITAGGGVLDGGDNSTLEKWMEETAALE